MAVNVNKALFIGLLLAAVILVAACGQEAVTCNKPYIIKGSECCLDNNGNGICDADEGLLKNASSEAAAQCPALDCTTCPATVVERNITKTLTKYVCEKDNSVVADPKECTSQVVSPFANYTLYNGSENASIIETFGVRPACRDGLNGLEVHFSIASSTPEVLLEVKESPNGQWRQAYTYAGGATDKYLYAVFCTSDTCAASRDFVLAPGQAYVLRARFDFRQTFGSYQYSNEYLVNDLEDSPYATKLCS